MTKPLVVKVLNAFAAVLVIAAGIAYFTLRTVPGTAVSLDLPMLPAPSASMSPSPSPSPPSAPTPSATPVKTATSKAPSPAAKPTTIAVTGVTVTCLRGTPDKVRLNFTVVTSLVVLHNFTAKTNISGFTGTVIAPSIHSGESMQVEGPPGAGDFTWSVSAELEDGGKWSRPMPSYPNPCANLP